MKSNTKLIIVGTIFFIIGFLFSLFLMASFNSGIKQAVELSIYACHDGCSIATRDGEDWLTNETWDCWEECNDYIFELLEDKK